MVKLLQLQDHEEKQEYVELIKTQLANVGNVTKADAKVAFMSIDPGINIEIINEYLDVSILLIYGLSRVTLTCRLLLVLSWSSAVECHTFGPRK